MLGDAATQAGVSPDAIVLQPTNLLDCAIRWWRSHHEGRECLAINDTIHTYLTACPLEDAGGNETHLVERGVDQKLRPDRLYIIRYGQADDGSIEEKRKQNEALDSE